MADDKQTDNADGASLPGERPGTLASKQASTGPGSSRFRRRTQLRLTHVGHWKQRLVFWVGAALVGLVSAAFAYAAESIDHLFRSVTAGREWLPLITLPLGLGFIAWVTVKWFPGAKGSGIPQAIAALQVGGASPLRQAVLSVRIAAAKIVLTLLGLLSGASIGREGPTVHIGAAIMFSLGRFAHFPSHYLERSLIVAGGAAGVAAAFNTPLAGIMFAIEELARSYDRRANSVVLAAVIIAGIVAMLVLGNYDYFGTAQTHFDLAANFHVILLVGGVGGLIGGLFSRGLIWSGSAMAPLYLRFPVRIAVLSGLVVALIGVLSGSSIYGTGYVEAQAILDSGSSVDPLYPLMKLLATAASYVSGIPGGIFAPSLSIGAGLGADLAQIFPQVDFRAVVLLAMVAYFAGVVQSPLTAFVIVMEMTNNQDMMIPLMATAFVATGVSRLVCEKPIYAAMAESFLDGSKRKSTEPLG